MSFAPVLTGSGHNGWLFLKRSLPSQLARNAERPEIKRDEAYFRQKIGAINTAQELVDDPKLLRVALGAFGLEGDTANKGFIRKVLEGGTLKPDALANKLANKQYAKLAAAFGFGDFTTPRSKLSDFPDKILGDYKTRQFEAAVGQIDDNMRLTLNLERELPAIAKRSQSSETTLWLTVLGNPPLRKVFETALGIPKALAKSDLDRQLAVFREKAQAQLGSSSLRQFSQPDKIAELTRRFHLRIESEAAIQATGSGATSLGLLQSAGLFRRL